MLPALLLAADPSLKVLHTDDLAQSRTMRAAVKTSHHSSVVPNLFAKARAKSLSSEAPSRSVR